MPVTQQNYLEVLDYHPPDAVAEGHYAAIRGAAATLVETILANTPTCGDQQAAIRLVREGVMTANAAVALKGAV